MAKTEVYSWRLDRDVKMGLEEQARRKGMTLAEFLDRTARHLIEEDRRQYDDDAEQARLHAAAAKCFGTLSGGRPMRLRKRQSPRAQEAKREIWTLALCSIQAQSLPSYVRMTGGIGHAWRQ
jgi:hypothetical protein